ncbi:MAG: hypothetical protein DWI10_07345 [Planctomycetota bacterium]|nr:MAG: hypothetical protein DWI10_07345 [Planctomycetota bacterium]
MADALRLLEACSSLARELEQTEHDFLDTIVDCIGGGVAIGAPASRAERDAMLEGLSLRAQRRWHREADADTIARMS